MSINNLMSLHLQFMQFANLLELARLSATGGEVYKEQERLILCCRELKIPFLATMPMRHRARCDICKVESGESFFHFENPAIPAQENSEPKMFGKPVGLWASAQTRQLHGIFAHSQDATADLSRVLSSVCC